jgi:hypothetical protein
MLSTLLLWTLASLPFLHAIPTTPLQKRCTNALSNPSFESGLDPWLAMHFGSWAQYGVYTSSEGGHSHSRNFYYARSNASVSDATMTLSQSGLNISSGTTVECSAWVASSRPGNVGSTRVEVFLDQVTCGSPAYLGTNGWQKVGGSVVVSGDSHTLAIVVSSDETGPDGSEIWVDDGIVGTGC